MPSPRRSVGPQRGRLVVGVAAIVLGLFGLTGSTKPVARLLLRTGIEAALSPDYARYRRVQAGWTEAEVLAHLGKPTKVFRAGADPNTYGIAGWGRPSRAVGHTLYVYVGSEPTVYIFVNSEGRVEASEVFGS